ncbi:MAG TPA: hypothetical protein DDY77_05685, partial [Clostridiales bacterium]|nr:hypothetical protein [Clostridiales bacterium]
MKVYFYSPVKAILEVNGERTTIGKNVKAAEFDSDTVFKIFALGFKPCRASFFYTELNKNVAIINLYKGFLVIPVLKTDFDGREVNFEKSVSLYGSQYYFSIVCKDKPYLTARGYRAEKTLALDILPKEVIVTPLRNHIAVEIKNKITIKKNRKENKMKTGNELVAYAKNRLGTPYFYGAKIPEGVLTENKMSTMHAMYPKVVTTSYMAKARRKGQVG